MIEAITARHVLESYRRLTIRWKTNQPEAPPKTRRREKDAAAEEPAGE